MLFYKNSQLKKMKKKSPTNYVKKKMKKKKTGEIWNTYFCLINRSNNERNRHIVVIVSQTRTQQFIAPRHRAIVMVIAIKYIKQLTNVLWQNNTPPHTQSWPDPYIHLRALRH